MICIQGREPEIRIVGALRGPVVAALERLEADHVVSVDLSEVIEADESGIRALGALSPERWRFVASPPWLQPRLRKLAGDTTRSTRV